MEFISIIILNTVNGAGDAVNIKLSEALLIAVLGSPVVTGLIHFLISRRSSEKQVTKINFSLENWRKEQAFRELRKANSHILNSDENFGNYEIKEWNWCYNYTNSIFNYEEWPQGLLEDTRLVRKIINEHNDRIRRNNG